MSQIVLQGFKAVDAASAASTQTSSAIDCKGINQLFILCTVAGATTPSATLTVYGACSDKAGNDSSYVALVAAQVQGTSAISANGTTSLIVPNAAFNKFKVEYTYTSGTGGTVTIWVAGKSLGA